MFTCWLHCPNNVSVSVSVSSPSVSNFLNSLEMQRTERCSVSVNEWRLDCWRSPQPEWAVSVHGWFSFSMVWKYLPSPTTKGSLNWYHIPLRLGLCFLEEFSGFFYFYYWLWCRSKPVWLRDHKLSFFNVHRFDINETISSYTTNSFDGNKCI